MPTERSRLDDRPKRRETTSQVARRAPRRSSLETTNTVADMVARRHRASDLLDAYLPDAESTPGVLGAHVDAEPGFILHTWDWSESSLLLDVLTLHYGRIFMVAKGAKRPSSQMRGLLTAFCPLLFSWSGKKEAKNLTRVEWLGTLMPLTGETLLSGFYVNELVIKLCEREERHPGLFQAYVDVIDTLAQGERDDIQPALRLFEKKILTLAGWAPTVVGAAKAEHYAIEDGQLVPTERTGDEVYPAQVVAALLRDDFAERRWQRPLRALLRELIEYHLGNRTINTRRILSELHQLMSHKVSER